MSFLSFRSVPISCRAPLNGGLVTIRSACSRSREHSADRQSPSPSSRESVLPGMQAAHATGMPGAGGRVTSNSIGRKGWDSMLNRLGCGFAQQEAMSLDQRSAA